MSKKNGKETQISTKTDSKKLLIRTARDLDETLSIMFEQVGTPRYNENQTRARIAIIAKKLSLENLKVRVGVYRTGRNNKNSLFLNA